LRTGDFEKLSFFESAILISFPKKKNLLHSHENQSKLLGYQGWVEISMITLVYSKRVSVRNNLLHSVSNLTLNNLHYIVLGLWKAARPAQVKEKK
jgi:hypothetical protein